MTDLDDRFRDWDAAYVLGSLSPDDRRSYERHLRTCAECAAAVSELAGLPGILGKLPQADAVALLTAPDADAFRDAHLRSDSHAPNLVQKLAGEARRSRRRRRARILAGALAAVIVLSAGGIAVALSQHSASHSYAMDSLKPGAISADLKLTAETWGTRFDWNCHYGAGKPSGGGGNYDGQSPSYDLVVTDKAGKETTVATWTGEGDAAGGLSASSKIPVAEIRRVIIRVTGSTTPLLRENL